MNDKSDQKSVVTDKKLKLMELTSKFCSEKLDKEYENLCFKLIEKMSRKREIPFLFGKIEVWAAAIVYAIGQINFLFDKSFEPYATPDDICDFFETNKSTTSQKAALIRDMFKMRHYDRNFSTSRMIEEDPFAELAMVNGFIVFRD